MSTEICRYCFEGSNLISPCNCIGSIKFIHEICLYNWIKSKYDNIEFDRRIFISCELCRKNYDIFIEMYSPFFISHSIKSIFLLLVLTFSISYLLIVYSIYIYCLEIIKDNCEYIKRYDHFVLCFMSMSLNIIYLYCTLEEYTKKIKITIL